MGVSRKRYAVGERRMGVEAVPEGAVERILVKMHGMSKR